MRRRLALVFLACVAGAAGAQEAQTFEARLTPLPLDFVNREQIEGSGSGSAVLDGRRLTVSGSFSGLLGPATVAHLHLGPALGIRGGPVLDLEVDQAAAGSFSGEFELTEEQLQALLDGRLYIQIHSEIAPGGNLWGWLLE
jgi:hypothetical protein